MSNKENNEITENEYSEKVGVIFEQIKNLIPRLEIGHAKEMSKIAKEPVTAELYENEDLYLFGSELACLRIAQANRHKKTNVGVANIDHPIVQLMKFAIETGENDVSEIRFSRNTINGTFIEDSLIYRSSI